MAKIKKPLNLDLMKEQIEREFAFIGEEVEGVRFVLEHKLGGVPCVNLTNSIIRLKKLVRHIHEIVPFEVFLDTKF